MHVAIESPDQPEVVELIAELDAYQRSLYPPESTHLLDLASLKQPNVLFVVARDAEHQAVGCGAIVLEPKCRVTLNISIPGSGIMARSPSRPSSTHWWEYWRYSP